jgi:hypothetical protein
MRTVVTACEGLFHEQHAAVDLATTCAAIVIIVFCFLVFQLPRHALRDRHGACPAHVLPLPWWLCTGAYHSTWGVLLLCCTKRRQHTHTAMLLL